MTGLHGLFKGKAARIMLVALVVVAAIGMTGCSTAIDKAGEAQKLSVEMPGAGEPGQVAVGVQVLILLTVLSVAPAFLIMTTSFVRIIIVLSLLRNALGVPQMPPNQVLVGLALFLTFFVMAPVAQAIDQEALQPFINGEVSQEAAFNKGVEPVRKFMFKQTREKDLSLFIQLAKLERPKNENEVPTHVLIPAFLISELKTGFQMGFIIFIPFLIIDIVVSSVLMSMGMMMLPPVMISLPFKILLFVMVDGWHLIIRSLVTSFG